MAFHLKASNALKELAVGLYQDLQPYKGSAFSVHTIVTQTEGMNNWLGGKLADWQGIAAGIQYQKPSDLIFKIYLLLGGSAEQSMSPENLSWLLFNLMGTVEFVERFPQIASYYRVEEGLEEDAVAIDVAKVKRLGLAKKVGDLFDQYQIYRSEMILQWNEGKMGDSGLEEWQFYLWKKMRAAVEAAGVKTYTDKNQVASFIATALEEPVAVAYLQQKLPAVFIFGISVLTEFHLQIFEKLSSKIQIYFYLLNPAPNDFWFEDLSEERVAFLKRINKIDPTEHAVGNPLLTSLGKVIMDTFNMLFKKEDILNVYDVLPERVPEPDSLLHKLQLAVFENKTPEKGAPIFELSDLQDGSISIHSCFSPLREVENLYEFLVSLIDQRKEQLSPRDIVVMVSDIDLYAAYIRAVFDNAPYRFPYRIADEKYTEADSITKALDSILSLEADFFTAETVMRLLDSSFIRNKLGIQRLELIRNVIREAGIRFGIEGNYKDDSIYVSWVYGLKRIMYGIAMITDQEVEAGPDGFYPLNLVEGSDSEEVIRFVYFVERLIQQLQQRSQHRSLAGWAAFVEEVLEEFIITDALQGGEEMDFVSALLADYKDSLVYFDEKVSYNVFMESFKGRLTAAFREGQFALGGVTFCSLIPMRSIPFKVVALLGLDYDKFPRKGHSLGFDLMELKRQPGDRNIKANDKHLFLETILSAEQYLYMSYIGRNIKNNTDIPASALIDELVAYIASECEASLEASDLLIQKHALHHYSNEPGNPTPKYLHMQSVGRPNARQPQAVAAVDEKQIVELPLSTFIRYIQHPIKGYLQDEAGIYYEDLKEALKEEEIFELDSLQNYQYRNELVQIEAKNEWETYIDKGIKIGRLPLKNRAQVVVKDLLEEVDPIRVLFEEVIQGEEKREVDVCYQAKKYLLTGRISLYGNKKVDIIWSKRNPMKSVLRSFVEYLLLVLSGENPVLQIISYSKQEIFTAESYDKPGAAALLNSLLDVYDQAKQRLLPFVMGLDLGKKQPEYSGWVTKMKTTARMEIYGKGRGVIEDHYVAKAIELGILSEPSFDQYLALRAVIEGPLKKAFSSFDFK